MKWPKELQKKGNKIIDNISFSNVSPTIDNVLRFMEMDLDNVKVIILGQDPYPTPGVANGRAFAVNKGQKIPQSLKNIFKEIKEVQGFVCTDETLQSWEEQGVMLLNTSLTVEFYKPNSHREVWKDFTLEVIKFLDQNTSSIFVLWGNEAKKYSEYISNEIIMDAHPSPLSVRHRNKKTFKKLKHIVW